MKTNAKEGKILKIITKDNFGRDLFTERVIAKKCE